MNNSKPNKIKMLEDLTRLGIDTPPYISVSDRDLRRISILEEITESEFGDGLIVSVRHQSNPAILNLGFKEGVLEEKRRITLDNYRRFIETFGTSVLKINPTKFERVIEQTKLKYLVFDEADLEPIHILELINKYKELVKHETEMELPKNPLDQLREAVNSDNPVIIQQMVYGNASPESFTAVAFSRHPQSGERGVVGEYLPISLGDDILEGKRFGQLLSSMDEIRPSLKEDIARITNIIERDYKDIVCVKFVYDGKNLYVTGVKPMHKNISASVRFAVESVKEGIRTSRESLLDIDAQYIHEMFYPSIDPLVEPSLEVMATGIPSSGGAVVGMVCLNPASVIRFKSQGYNPILVRKETYPEDIGGIMSSVGVLTTDGGLTSHASVVARGLGKSCVVGAKNIFINSKEKYILCGRRIIKEGGFISIDGNSGRIYGGKVPLVIPTIPLNFSQFLDMVNGTKKMQIRANADSIDDVRKALEYGAEGIGLCRTEHMFFRDRLPLMAELILAYSDQERKAILSEMSALQSQDFVDLYSIAGNRPVTIRLLDPPLHEFLPHSADEKKELAEKIGISYEQLEERVSCLTERNPMLGHRGARIAITHPEIYKMQVSAIFEAVSYVRQQGNYIVPEIMIPFINSPKEFLIIKGMIDQTAKSKRFSSKDYLIGTMIEIPRAAFVADEIVKAGAQFFSFGTNDLTQMALGYSRDDVAKFLPSYLEKGIVKENPFKVLDEEVVGELVLIAAYKGKSVNPDLKLGVCGEHGADPRSIQFFHKAGIDYISCSPFGVFTAILSATQSALAYEHGVLLNSKMGSK